jgi:glucose/mannose-6-phosphate isomerase
MGGSSVAGEMLSLVLDEVVVHWDYDLPVTTAPQDLVVCCSWSGNTQETLSSYQEARQRKIPVAVITGGGELGERARKDAVPLVILPDVMHEMPARCGAGFMIGALFELTGNTPRLPPIAPADLEASAKRLADALGSRMPVFYTAYPWRKIAGWYKTIVNENAKRHAFASNFPSAAHNEIMGWNAQSVDTVAPVLIRAPGDERYSADATALVAILERMGYTVSTVALPNGTVLQQAIFGYISALWTGYHCGVSAGIDPMSTALIEEFKRLKANA